MMLMLKECHDLSDEEDAAKATAQAYAVREVSPRRVHAQDAAARKKVRPHSLQHCSNGPRTARRRR